MSNVAPRALSEHLAELRGRLLMVVGLFFAFFIALYIFKHQLINILLTPLYAAGVSQVIAVGVMEVFVTQLKIAAYGAALLTLPVLLGQIWLFVAPGLYQREQSTTRLLVWGGPVLLLAGVLFCWFAVLPAALKFMVMLAGEQVDTLPAVGLYLTLVVRLLLAFGLVFQLPLLLWGLVRLDVVSLEQLANMRRYVLVLAVAVGAILTPPDPFTQLLLAIPVWLFYELTLALLKHTKPKENDKD